MPRPFPFPFNIGTDICSIDRVYNILKGSNGRRFVRRILNEQERHEGLERLDRPLERWKLAGRVSDILEWKRKQLGLTVKELEKRRYKLKVQAGGLGKWAVLATGEGGKKVGRKIKGEIREELRRELEREVRAEEEAGRRLELEKGEKELRDQNVVLAQRHSELGEEESAVVFDEEGNGSSEADKKMEAEFSKEEVTSEQKKQKRLDDVDIMIRLQHDHEKELVTAAEGLWSAAEFLAGRFAAKEAAIKAHHNRKLTYHSIAIHRPPSTDPSEGSQPPVAVILPDSGEWEEGQEARISISHDGEYATATCLAFEPKPRHRSNLPRARKSTGAISETSKHIYTELEMDDMEPDEEEEEHEWLQTQDALQEKDEELAGINDPRHLVKVERLSINATEEDLFELFKGKSERLRVHIAVGADGKRRGYAFVSFANSREAVKARGEKDRKEIKGQRIICRWMGGKRGSGTGRKGGFKGEMIGPWVEYVQPEGGGKAEIQVSER